MTEQSNLILTLDNLHIICYTIQKKAICNILQIVSRMMQKPQPSEQPEVALQQEI